MDPAEFVLMANNKLKIAMEALVKIAEFGEDQTKEVAIEAITQIDPFGHSPYKRWVKNGAAQIKPN